MSRSRLTAARDWLVVASACLAAAAVLLIGASDAGLASVELPRWADDDSLLVVAFITITVSAGALLVNVNWLLGRRESTLPDPEATPAAPVAGSDLDRVVGRRLLAPYLAPDDRRRVRERLRRTAVRTVRRTEDVPRQRADALVERGAWTDDATAAAFLGRPATPRPVRLCARVTSQVAFRYQARRTARAIVTIADDRGDG